MSLGVESAREAALRLLAAPVEQECSATGATRKDAGVSIRGRTRKRTRRKLLWLI